MNRITTSNNGTDNATFAKGFRSATAPSRVNSGCKFQEKLGGRTQVPVLGAIFLRSAAFAVPNCCQSQNPDRTRALGQPHQPSAPVKLL